MKTPLILALLLAPSVALLAQDPPSGPQGHRPPPPPPLLVALDANKDGVLSADELTNAPDALKTLDKNGDGQLTREEFCPKPPPASSSQKRGKANKKDSAKHRPPPPDPLVKALDVNLDRVLSAEEIAGAANALATLDKNADGQLTREEFAPKPPRRQPHGPSAKPSPSPTPVEAA